MDAEAILASPVIAAVIPVAAQVAVTLWKRYKQVAEGGQAPKPPPV